MRHVLAIRIAAVAVGDAAAAAAVTAVDNIYNVYRFKTQLIVGPLHS